MDLQAENKFSLFCVFSAAARFLKKIEIVEARYKQFSEFILLELANYHVAAF